jgi:fatty acid desaturase
MSEAARTASASGEEFRVDLKERRGLPPESVKRLNRINPVLATVSVVRTWTEIAVLVALPLIWWEWYVIAPAMMLLATRAQALFVLAHDAAHYRLYETRWLNDLVGRICAAPTGISMRAYRVIHRLHHNHLFGKQDPDTPIHGGYPRGRWYLIQKLLRDIGGLTAWKTYAYFWGAPSSAQTKPDPTRSATPRPAFAARRLTTAGLSPRFTLRLSRPQSPQAGGWNICCSG